MKLKPNVRLTDLKPQLLIAIIIANDIYKRYSHELVLTSVDDSTHGTASLHDNGLAVDLRTYYFLPTEIKQVVNELRNSLNSEFDVVLEKDHIHIEYDPK